MDPLRIVEWISTRADLDPQPGGGVALDMPAHRRAARLFGSSPRPRRLYVGIPGDAALPPGSSTVEILLKADGDETIVELTHRALPAEMLSRQQAGWDECFEKLRQVANL